MSTLFFNERFQQSMKEDPIGLPFDLQNKPAPIFFVQYILINAFAKKSEKKMLSIPAP